MINLNFSTGQTVYYMDCYNKPAKGVIQSIKGDFIYLTNLRLLIIETFATKNELLGFEVDKLQNIIKNL